MTNGLEKAKKLTRGQVRALRWLADLKARFPTNDYGFNPTYHASEAAICRRVLASMGLVHLNRLSEHHIRYAITPLGLTALQQIEDQK